MSDLTRREFSIVGLLLLLTVLLGVYPAPLIDGLNFYVSGLIYSTAL